MPPCRLVSRLAAERSGRGSLGASRLLVRRKCAPQRAKRKGAKRRIPKERVFFTSTGVDCTRADNSSRDWLREVGPSASTDGGLPTFGFFSEEEIRHRAVTAPRNYWSCPTILSMVAWGGIRKPMLSRSYMYAHVPYARVHIIFRSSQFKISTMYVVPGLLCK
jgi:hypothetical protein